MSVISESVVGGLNQGAMGPWGGPLCLLMVDSDYDTLIPFQSVLFLLSVFKVSRGRQLRSALPYTGLGK